MNHPTLSRIAGIFDPNRIIMWATGGVLVLGLIDLIWAVVIFPGSDITQVVLLRWALVLTAVAIVLMRIFLDAVMSSAREDKILGEMLVISFFVTAVGAFILFTGTLPVFVGLLVPVLNVVLAIVSVFRMQ